MINVTQLRGLIIKPALDDLVMYSEQAEELLVFTCAVESNGGTYLKQIHGDALGIYQMEPTTYNDLWENYIKNKTGLLFQLLSCFNVTRMPTEDRMIYDLRYATAMARIHYKRFSKCLPLADDISGIWDYYKTFYNTEAGKAQREPSINKYLEFIKT